MRGVKLTECGEVYRCAREVSFTRHLIQCPELLDFWRAMRRLDAALGDKSEDQYWRRVQGRLWRYWVSVCATPLSFHDPLLCPPELRTFLREHLLGCELGYSRVAPQAKLLFQAFESLCVRGENPMREEIIESCQADAVPTALVIRETRLLPAVESEFAGEYRHLRPVSPTELLGGECYQRLIVVGPTRWFPEALFRAPRASEMHILVPEFIRDNWQAVPTFVGSIGVSPTEASVIVREVVRARIAPITDPLCQEECVDAERLLPSLNWDEILANEGTSSRDYEEDPVEALVYLLEGDRAIFLDASERATTLVLDLRDYDSAADAKGVVRRIRVGDLAPGMFLLVRAGGGGDLIGAVADSEVLGENLAKIVRETQQDWKSRLRESVRTQGLTEVAIELLERGARLANEANVRNWMSKHNIRPYYKEDFFAILSFVDLAARAEEYRKNALIIDRAHRSAGFIISKRLVERIPKLDLRPLRHLGVMNLEYGARGGGSVTAIRVLQRLPETREVPASRIEHPFFLGNEPWRE